MTSSQAFEKFLAKAWVDHATHPQEVCARVVKAAAEVHDAECVQDAARLITHLYGVHFGEWADGIAALQSLKTHRAWREGSALDAKLNRSIKSLELAWDTTTDLSMLCVPDQIHAYALTSECVLERGDFAAATEYLREAANRAEKLQVEDATGALRALAIAGNNFAVSLEEIPMLTSAQRDAMLYAAHVGRTYWAKAGTWVEIERAEYRLSKCCLKAGKHAAARAHAQACLRVCEEHSAPALEFFFGIEALLRAMLASANDGEYVSRLRQKAQTLFDALDKDDQQWCEPTYSQMMAAK
jgi:hypothetical protein